MSPITPTQLRGLTPWLEGIACCHGNGGVSPKIEKILAFVSWSMFSTRQVKLFHFHLLCTSSSSLGQKVVEGFEVIPYPVCLKCWNSNVCLEQVEGGWTGHSKLSCQMKWGFQWELDFILSGHFVKNIFWAWNMNIIKMGFKFCCKCHLKRQERNSNTDQHSLPLFLAACQCLIQDSVLLSGEKSPIPLSCKCAVFWENNML